MDDDLIDSIRYAMKARRKRRTNHYYGQSPIESLSTTTGSTIKYSRSTQKKRLKATSGVWTFVDEPTYENPWDAKVWRQWQGRAEEFWDARLQGRIFWEREKNGDGR